jgi:hypothetical protein
MESKQPQGCFMNYNRNNHATNTMVTKEFKLFFEIRVPKKHSWFKTFSLQ